MRKLDVKGQRILKFIHLLFSCLWVGGALGLLLMTAFLNPHGVNEALHGQDVARKFVDDFLVIPGAMGCLISGLLISVFTPWGFFKHRWVTVKWILTVFSILFGTFVLGPLVNGQPIISSELGLKALENHVYTLNRLKNIYLGLGQCAIIIFMVYISVMKPWRKSKSQQIKIGSFDIWS